jgi:hypothetical protein
MTTITTTDSTQISYRMEPSIMPTVSSSAG